jgi:hypothetical protein
MTLMTVNSWLAGVIALVALGGVARMTARTNCAVRWAVLLLMVSAGGQWLGFATGVWDHYLDTMLYGGILALLLANQRQPQWVIDTWSKWSAYAVLGLTVAIVIAYFAIAPAEASAPAGVPNLWLVGVIEDPAGGTVTLGRGDFDAIVGHYNAQHRELERLRIMGCP